MRAHAADEFVVVDLERQRLFHLQIRQPPVPGLVVQVVLAVLEADSNVLFRGLANDARICVAVADIREAADRGPDFAELVRLLPGDRPGADAARRPSADRAAPRVLAQL